MLPDKLTSPLNDLSLPKTGDYIFIIKDNWKELVDEYHKITAPNVVVARYAIGGRHCWEVFLTGMVRENKKTRSK